MKGEKRRMRIKDLPSASTVASDGYIAYDHSSEGTKKITLARLVSDLFSSKTPTTYGGVDNSAAMQLFDSWDSTDLALRSARIVKYGKFCQFHISVGTKVALTVGTYGNSGITGVKLGQLKTIHRPLLEAVAVEVSDQTSIATMLIDTDGYLIPQRHDRIGSSYTIPAQTRLTFAGTFICQYSN